MHHLPVELWLKIFLLACSDGGLTGCALSLVSHLTSELSAPLRFHTIALHSYTQLAAFAALLDRSIAPIPPIHHLYAFNRVCDLETQEDMWTPTLARIIPHAAPTLRSLVVPAGKPSKLGDRRALHAVPLPRLAALTMTACSGLHGMHLSNIQRLHVTIPEGWGVFDLLADLGGACPALVKLSLGCRYPCETMLHFLLLHFQLADEEFAWVKEDLDSDPQGWLALVRSVRSLTALQTVYIEIAREGPESADAERGWGALDSMARRIEGDGRLVLLHGWPHHAWKQALQDWEDFIEGGEGAWSATRRISVGMDNHNNDTRHGLFGWLRSIYYR